MYNGTAYVSTNSTKVPVYEFDEYDVNLTNNRIGWINPNECFGMHPTEADIPFVAFRNASGGTSIGGINPSDKLTCVLYGKKKSNGTTLLDNPLDSDGYYRHTLSKEMNWYIGSTKQLNPLPKGTLIQISDCTTGSDHYYRIACKKAKRPTDTKFKELNPGGIFWIDFLTTGSMPSNRSLW